MQHLGLSHDSFGHDQVAGRSGINNMGSHRSTFLVSTLITMLVCGWKSFIDATLMIASKHCGSGSGLCWIEAQRHSYGATFATGRMPFSLASGCIRYS